MVVVEYVPTKYGMIFSRRWENNMGGIMQIDMNFFIFLVFATKRIKLYREANFAYVISDQNNPNIFSMYALEEEMDVVFCQSMISMSPTQDYSLEFEIA